MKLLGITDLHGHTDALARILEHVGPVDAVLLGGDITHFGSPIDAERLVRRAQQSVPLVLAVAGNCDSQAVDRRLEELGVSLAGRGLIRDGVGLHGLSGIPPWKPGMYQFPENQLAEQLLAGAAQITSATYHVVLSHVPPRSTPLDRTLFGCQVGSTALREFIEQRQPHVVICGHIHEGRGQHRLGATTVVNCGYGGAGHYALAELGESCTISLGRA